ncbi:unnamed protein product [Strongylus vulgaris]|uniref:Endonuclease/exonuclease/phosphatase domain-containing protein n=1 Tax=Strongylus vulgaris TaxID=40348 RepID=A0A3P7I8Q3_STRVU|nr:unnamed protein product [Strongylus vulgaris]
MERSQQQSQWRGIAVSESLRSRIAAVDRLSDRLMSIKIDTGRKILRIVAAYAPQTGCKEEEKNMFWQERDDYIASIPQDEILLLGADLNGHGKVIPGKAAYLSISHCF